ncbi:MAG: protein kinase domain-containing protein [Actinomycetota bacterium]
MICPTCSTVNPPGAAVCRTCGAPLSAPAAGVDPHALPPGTVLRGGGYQIERVLGQGGFGITYQGRDLALDRSVAIKEFFPTGSGRKGAAVQAAGGLTPEEYAAARQRFLEESRVLARFHHPGIVQVYTSFEEHNTAYMVMELLRGKTLAGWLEEHGPMPEGEAVPAIERVGEALAIVHDAGLLHRDIKPDNIIRADDGRTVLIDFGTAREFAAGKTHRMTTLLTPGYAPLEQYSQQARFGTFTDVYALAATLYHLLTGQLPVSALDRVQGVTLPAPHTLRPEISRSVSDAIMWALEVSVAKRPASAREFLKALRAGPAPRVPGSDPARTGANATVRSDAGSYTVEDVIQLCERDPQAAEKHLYSGELERWLAKSLRGTAVSSWMREIVARHPRERWKGLELLQRELYRSRGEDPYPRLEPDPPLLDLGEVVVGGRTTANVRLRNQGRGHAWGVVEVHPPLPGVSVPREFHSAAARIEVDLDTVHTDPGEYSGQIIISPEGVPSQPRVPLRYRVLALEVSVEPKRVDLGALRAGDKATAALRVTTRPAGGRLVGTATLSRFAEGVSVTPTLSGSAPEIQVAVDTRSLPAGQTYRSDVLLKTNAGTYSVPIRFRITLPWGTVASQAIRGALLWGLGLGIGRAAIGMAVGAGVWMAQSPVRPESLLPAWAVALGVWLGVATETARVRRALGRRLASWAGLRWLLGGFLLGCAGLLVMLAGLGMGLITALDRIGQGLLPLPLPVAAWAGLGALVGTLFGSALGLIRAGRPSAGVSLHWAAIVILLLLGM